MSGGREEGRDQSLAGVSDRPYGPGPEAPPPPGAGPGDSPSYFPSSPGPPPGGYGSAPPPPSYGPRPREESSGCRVIAIGCLLLLALGIAGTGVSCYLVAKRSGEVFPALFKMLKPGYLELLTPDHEQEEINRFSELYDTVFYNEVKRLGLFKWAEAYESLLSDLARISEDKEITREESKEWCRKAYDALEENGYREE